MKEWMKAKYPDDLALLKRNLEALYRLKHTYSTVEVSYACSLCIAAGAQGTANCKNCAWVWFTGNTCSHQAPSNASWMQLKIQPKKYPKERAIRLAQVKDWIRRLEKAIKRRENL
jgi:hypothetical protein